ncbi:MAG: site-specific integrase [Bacteroidales bacterium]|nr:site-specific integrase [Bacteroidales bacterium]
MTRTNTFGVIFYLKKQKEKDGKAPIYARITVDGRRAEVSIKKEIDIANWSFGKGMAKGKGEEIRMLNTYLEQIRSRIVECYQQLQLKKVLITADSVKNKFLGIEEKEHSLMNLFDYHNQEMKNLLEWGTLKNYYTTKRYFQMYIREVLRTSDIFLSQLSYKFLVGYEKFMREHKPLDPKKPCNQNTIMKHIERLRKVVNLAIKNEWLELDPFLKFSPTFIRKDRDFLTAEELAAIEAKNFSIVRLQHAKDLFVFSCYTGLAYIDSYNLTPQNIALGIDGEYWLTTCRKKTDQPVRIPLLPKAMEIIDKYKTHPTVMAKGKILPVYSNQKLNSYLKEIADLCGIEKNLTFHIARHTFATTVTLTNGVPIETVSKLLGHTSIKTTQIYAKVIEKKVSDDMRMLREKLSNCGIDKNNTTLKLKKSGSD